MIILFIQCSWPHSRLIEQVHSRPAPRIVVLPSSTSPRIAFSSSSQLSLRSHSLSFTPLTTATAARAGRAQDFYCRIKIMSTAAPPSRLSLLLLLVQVALLSLQPSTTTALILNYTTRGCSKHCESINCNNAQRIRYGKFCGVGYTGCPNQSPCDRLDACCRQHDVCVGTNPANFPNQTCHSNLRSCLQQYLATGAVVYRGSNCTAMTVQNTVMVALESTTFPHQHLAPGLAPGHAPQTGTAAPQLNYVSARLLLPCIFLIAVFLSCFCSFPGIPSQHRIIRSCLSSAS